MLSLNRVRKAHKQERFPQSAEFKYIYWPTAPGQLQQQVWEGCAGGGAQLVELPACPALAGAAMKHGGAGRVEGAACKPHGAARCLDTRQQVPAHQHLQNHVSEGKTVAFSPAPWGAQGEAALGQMSCFCVAAPPPGAAHHVHPKHRPRPSTGLRQRAHQKLLPPSCAEGGVSPLGWKRSSRR